MVVHHSKGTCVKVFNEACHVSVVAWADNADACSKQYTGTGALKTDFTR